MDGIDKITSRISADMEMCIRDRTETIRHYSLFHVMSMYHRRNGKSSAVRGKTGKISGEGSLFIDF